MAKTDIRFFGAGKCHRINRNRNIVQKYGSLNIPNLQLYYEAAQFVNVIKFLAPQDNTSSHWIDLEGVVAPPLFLLDILWSKNKESRPAIKIFS